MSRGLHMFLAIILISQTIFTSLGFGAVTEAEGTKDKVVKDVAVSEGEDGTVEVQVDWSVKGLDVEADDEETFTAPEQIAIEEVQQGDLQADGETIGAFSVATDGEVTVIFNEKVSDYPEAEGTFTFIGVVEVEEETDGDVADDGEKEEIEKAGAGENEDEVSKKEEEEVKQEAEQEKEEKTKKNDDAEVKEEKASDKASKKSSPFMQANDDGKHGFTLELDEILDLDNQAFDEQHPMDPHKEFKLKLDWELEDGHNYSEGDTETFELPKGIKIQDNIEIELKDESGQIIANAIVKPDKTVELTFTNFVEGHSAVSGWMEIISELDIGEVEEEDGEVIIDPIGEEGELRIPIEKENTDKTIEKNGEPNKGYNADEINWEVIVNKNKNSLKDAKVIDELPAGTEYKDGSLKVTKLKADLNGNILGDLEEVEIELQFGDGGELIVPLGNTSDAYRVEYVTEVTDDEEKAFKNNATITDEELEAVSADSTVTINRGEPIKKSAVTDYNPKTGIIEWEIEFNYNQKDLSDVTLNDAWTPEGMLELVEDSLKFQEVSIDENGNAHHEGEAVNVPDGAELNEIADGFEVTGISTNTAYKVTYQTKVIDRVLDSEDVSNTAGFGSESDSSGTHIGQYYGSKSAGNIDYSEKTIEWTIRVNHDEYPMENISIEDTLGEGLTLLEETVNVTVGGESYDDHILSGDNPFTIDFPENYTTDKEIIINYKTEFNADEVPDHQPTNKAAITWTPEGENDSITKEVETGTELNKETADYSWKNGSYNPQTKEITWEIIANYRENDIAELIIQDEPQGNQQIIEGSAVVRELNIAANGSYTDGDTVEDAATINKEANTLIVNLGETNKAYKITYKTSLEGLADMQDEYVNEAEVFDGDEQISEIDAKVGIVKDSKYGSKSGEQDGKQVHWSIDVNFVQQKVNDLKLVDSISENQEYLEDSIKVYHANIDGNGNASKGDEVSSDAYTLDIDQDAGEFTIEWNDEVEHAFILDYSTLFFAGHNENVSNDYTITGDSIAEEESDASGSDNVTISQLGSGGGEGTAGYLVIDKVDTTYGEEETDLAGAEFDLIDTDTGNILKSGTTDENGQIDFGRLLFGNYTLVETKVPEGYVTPEEEQTIAIDKAYQPNDDKEGFEYRVENYQPIFAVELSKTDDEGNTLENAEFTLFDSVDNKVATETTNEDGKILFEDLKEAGTYYVKETKAPAGYVLEETKHEVPIGEKEKEPITISAENNARGVVQLTKTDIDTGDFLAGVEFVLQKENDSGGYDTVSTHTTDDKGQIKTSNTLEAGNYQFVETKTLDGYRTDGTPIKFTVNIHSTETQEFTMENEQFKGSVKLIKSDAATQTKLADAEFKLVDAEGEVVEEGLVTTNDGELIIDDLFLGEYQLIETKAPTGYELDETPIDIEITADNQVVEKTMTNNRIIDIPVEKKWNNDGGDTAPVTIKLLPTDQTVELNEDNDWKATFENLDVYDETGDAIDYQVEELDVDGYNAAITGNASDGFIVTNTEAISVSGEKTWKDDDSDERPDQITVQLFADEEKVRQEIVTAADGWEYTFEDLDKYDEDGEEISYTIDEIAVDGYKTNIDEFNIENVRVGTISVNGEKTWQDVDATDRPASIEVNLSREVDGETDEDFSESKTVKPNNQGTWLYEFTDLAEFDENGVAYTYLVEEDNVPENYRSTVDGHDITNVRIGETEVSGTKRWKDDTVEDRPDVIEVNLLRNNVVIDTQEVTADDSWKYEFTELDKYDDEGQLYDYTVKEQDVEGYDSKVNGHDITNTRSDQKSIEITKGWLDDNSEDRPESVVVYLYQNGDLFDTQVVTADNDWKYEFTDLEAYDGDGQSYAYTVKEKPVEGYESTVDGLSITNLRVGETKVSGMKTWLDDDSADRPEEITVKLLANGEETDETITVDADSDWQYEFTDLDKYDYQGKEIVYTVDEEAVEGYEKSFDANDITNLRVGKTEVTGEKNWVEVDERYRPDTITVQLLANGALEDTFEVSDETNWSYGFSGLEKYDEQGKEILYTVEESDVPKGYTSEVDGENIINTQDSIEVTGEKSWEEVNSEYRADSITVQLLANGEEEATVEVSSKTDWIYTFTDLAKYDKDGKEIDYTVEELDVPAGYDSQVDGYNITNTQNATEVTGEKLWEEVDERYRPDLITVQLLANGEEAATVEVSSETDWSYAFTDLAKYDKDGKEIDYTVEEPDVPVGYDSKVDGYNITNTQDSTEVTGEKDWEEVNSEHRPDLITVQLLANGAEEATVEVSSETDWSYAFTNLAKYDKAGEEIKYTIEELDVPAGYDSEVDGYDIINTQKVTEVSGTKAWLDDGSKDRPNSITVQVKNGDQVIDEREVTAEDEWNYSFTDLPQYNKEGKEINYIVDEEKVNGYKKSIKGHDITNLRVGETDVAGTKTWKGDKADNRPDMITVHLLQNGEVVDTEEVTAEDDWEYSFTDLPAYDEKGVAYEYAVAEDEVKGYKTSVDGFDITNTFIKEDAETSEEPGSTGDPKDSDQPGGDQTVSVDAKPSDETAEETKAGALPKTATNLFRMLFVGSALLLVGAGIMLIRRKRYS